MIVSLLSLSKLKAIYYMAQARLVLEHLKTAPTGNNIIEIAIHFRDSVAMEVAKSIDDLLTSNKFRSVERVRVTGRDTYSYSFPQLKAQGKI